MNNLLKFQKWILISCFIFFSALLLGNESQYKHYKNTFYKLMYFANNTSFHKQKTPTTQIKNMKKTKYDLSKLTKEEYRITQKQGTELAFNNAYWNHKAEGIYVDVVSGQALFSSLDKYDSGTGWPSFTKAISLNSLETQADATMGIIRKEIHSTHAKTHLGHVFNDGPKKQGGQRFCVNSASLRFIPVKELQHTKYEKYIKLFKKSPSITAQQNIATLAGGCFWGVEHLLKNIPGVLNTTVGYIGGNEANPTYNIVSTGRSQHAEAVQITFDPKKISYSKILQVFWRLHNPTELNKQGPDVGTQYRSAIFYHSLEQKNQAQASMEAFNKQKVFEKPAVTQIVKASLFYPAEDFHQDYFEKSPSKICHSLRDK